jgi:hypothetical protein
MFARCAAWGSAGPGASMPRGPWGLGGGGLLGWAAPGHTPGAPRVFVSCLGTIQKRQSPPGVCPSAAPTSNATGIQSVAPRR